MKIHSLKSELILSPLSLCGSSYFESGNTAAYDRALEAAGSGTSVFVCMLCDKLPMHHLSDSGTIHLAAYLMQNCVIFYSVVYGAIVCDIAFILYGKCILFLSYE